MSGDVAFDARALVEAVRRRARFVFGVGAAAAVLTFGVASVLPRWYTASTTLMPPEEGDLLSNISMAQRALTKFPAFGILNDYFTPADVYKAVLGSRTVKEAIVHEFDLQKVYRQKSLEKTLRALQDHTKIKLNPDGTIKVSVEDRKRDRAAAMANAYVRELDRFNVEKRNSTARRTREFLQRRVAEEDSLLRRSEADLRSYQEDHRAVAPGTAEGTSIQAAAEVMSRKLMLEVRLGVLRGYLREDNAQVVQVRTELEQLEARIAALPRLQGDLQRLVRDSKVHEQVFLMLTAELEQARVREAMDTPTVQVMDPAFEPERHSRPKRTLLALAAAVLATAVAAAWVAASEREPAHSV